MEISFFQFSHAHMFIEFYSSGVITVNIEPHLTGRRMNTLNVADSLIEEIAPNVFSLKFRENVDFL